jgi:hypothetical protein
MTHVALTERSIKKMPKNIIIACTIIAVVIAIATAIVVWQIKRSNSGESKDSTAVSSKIITKVGTHYVLPTNETPTVAQIQNKDSLEKDQEFYQGAENGDYLLIYTKAKIAILYRESLDKLVRVSPVATPADPSKQ